MAGLHKSFLRARRETIQILAAWIVCLLWTIGYCALFAYGDGPTVLVWGLPSWVVFGIALPWASATVFSVWYTLTRIQDEAAA